MFYLCSARPYYILGYRESNNCFTYVQPVRIIYWVMESPTIGLPMFSPSVLYIGLWRVQQLFYLCSARPYYILGYGESNNCFTYVQPVRIIYWVMESPTIVLPMFSPSVLYIGLWRVQQLFYLCSARPYYILGYGESNKCFTYVQPVRIIYWVMESPTIVLPMFSPSVLYIGLWRVQQMFYLCSARPYYILGYGESNNCFTYVQPVRIIYWVMESPTNVLPMFSPPVLYIGLWRVQQLFYLCSARPYYILGYGESNNCFTYVQPVRIIYWVMESPTIVLPMFSPPVLYIGLWRVQQMFYLCSARPYYILGYG